jgi:arabinose-5-phosphate isomerase
MSHLHEPPPFDAQRALNAAKEAMRVEASALNAINARLEPTFAHAVQAVLACTGRVVVMGMGKSGHVGNKIAATLASTGMITPNDVILAISNSGESDEFNAILPVIKRMGIPLIALTGRADSSLARHADHVINSQVDKEACPLNLAPTASTTAQMALGDALAIALLDARGFKPADFARSHPGGALGRKLLTHVRDIMRRDPHVPAVKPTTKGLEMMQEMGDKGLGATAITDANGIPIGIFTDGDLRRLIAQGGDLRVAVAQDIMRPNPRTINQQALAAEAADLMETHAVTSLLVVDDTGRLVGAINSNDLMRAKVI